MASEAAFSSDIYHNDFKENLVKISLLVILLNDSPKELVFVSRKRIQEKPHSLSYNNPRILLEPATVLPFCQLHLRLTSTEGTEDMCRCVQGRTDWWVRVKEELVEVLTVLEGQAGKGCQ